MAPDVNVVPQYTKRKKGRLLQYLPQQYHLTVGD